MVRISTTPSSIFSKLFSQKDALFHIFLLVTVFLLLPTGIYLVLLIFSFSSYGILAAFLPLLVLGLFLLFWSFPFLLILCLSAIANIFNYTPFYHRIDRWETATVLIGILGILSLFAPWTRLDWVCGRPYEAAGYEILFRSGWYTFPELIFVLSGSLLCISCPFILKKENHFLLSLERLLVSSFSGLSLFFPAMLVIIHNAGLFAVPFRRQDWFVNCRIDGSGYATSSSIDGSGLGAFLCLILGSILLGIFLRLSRQLRSSGRTTYF